ncbi:hypothetical protein [Pseudomonas phage PMBT14]|uniref:Uncharacterized protein n=1 Tax=Pseudomonas phage PMBT14 TaxID=2059855 RepID=A0A2I6PI70_9CAUD|nr:hypothetical protein HWB42_gp39 [Pseudomonas phage PMBT14]AUM59756.1 hypothetical protein [Pseudomonas phage PMBT14]
MNASQIQARIATLETIYNSFTRNAKLADKAAVIAKIRTLQAQL